MLSRRDAMGKLAAGGAVLLAAGAAGAALAPATDERATGTVAPQDEQFRRSVVDAGPAATGAADSPWELISPLTMGAAVAHGWRVAGLSGAVDGSCVLTLQNEQGKSHRVHVCRNDGSPQGLVYTDRFDLLVMNGGQGDLATDESLAQAVAEVAHRLSANEHGRRPAEVVASLLPHDERLRRITGAGLR